MNDSIMKHKAKRNIDDLSEEQTMFIKNADSLFENAISIKEHRLQNPENPFELYGMVTGMALELSSSDQAIHKPWLSERKGVLQHLFKAHSFINAYEVPELNVKRLGLFEVQLLNKITEKYTIEPTEFKQFIHFIISIEQELLSKSLCKRPSRDRLLGILTAIRYPVIFFASHDFYLNGTPVQRDHDWCVRFNSWMKAELGFHDPNLQDYIEFVVNYGAGPGGSVLVAMVDCIIQA